MAPSSASSLVKYENPVLISTSKDKAKSAKDKTSKKVSLQASSAICAPAPAGSAGNKKTSSPTPGRKLQGTLPPVEQKGAVAQTEDILNSILPPRCAWAAQQAFDSSASLVPD
jgi:dynein light intermediate chain